MLRRGSQIRSRSLAPWEATGRRGVVGSVIYVLRIIRFIDERAIRVKIHVCVVKCP